MVSSHAMPSFWRTDRTAQGDQKHEALLLLSALRCSLDVQSLPPKIGADLERVRTEGTGHQRGQQDAQQQDAPPDAAPDDADFFKKGIRCSERKGAGASCNKPATSGLRLA